MPLYTIKHLKAPWPAGAKVGDVIEFDVLPGWALGKCEAGGSQATVFAGNLIHGDGSGVALPPLDGGAFTGEDHSLAELTAVKADLAASLEREQALFAQVADLEEQLAKAKPVETANDAETTQASEDDAQAAAALAEAEAQAAEEKAKATRGKK